MSNELLQNYLSHEFIESKYDVKKKEKPDNIKDALKSEKTILLDPGEPLKAEDFGSTYIKNNTLFEDKDFTFIFESIIPATNIKIETNSKNKSKEYEHKIIITNPITDQLHKYKYESKSDTIDDYTVDFITFKEKTNKHNKFCFPIITIDNKIYYITTIDIYIYFTKFIKIKSNVLWKIIFNVKKKDEFESYYLVEDNKDKIIYMEELKITFSLRYSIENKVLKYKLSIPKDSHIQLYLDHSGKINNSGSTDIISIVFNEK